VKTHNRTKQENNKKRSSTNPKFVLFYIDFKEEYNAKIFILLTTTMLEQFLNLIGK
jgi:hypothetical protein